MPHKTVGDLMHKGVIACGPETTMVEVVRIVNDTSVHAIIVMEHEDHPLGLVSHLDIVSLYGEDLAQRSAKDVMRRNVITIEPSQPARAGADLMLEHGVDHLLVIESEGDRQIPVGVLSTTDLVKDMRGTRWIWHVS